MLKILPIDLRDLLQASTVKPERIEFKAAWDPKTTGPQVVRTVCAFANDFQRLNGGYIVIGAAERDGRAELPPRGLTAKEVRAAQKWIVEHCCDIRPAYHPILSPEVVDDRHYVLVVWASRSGADGPHAVEDGNGGSTRYWIRLGSKTVDAERSGHLAALVEQAARVSFDDRIARQARIEDIRESRVREYLRDVDSGLLHGPDPHDVYRRMRITGADNGLAAPRNVGLLMFSSDPREWFRGAHIEVVRFAADRAGAVLDERVFRGGLVQQVHDTLTYLDEASVYDHFPAAAVRETLVNAVCHRSYRADSPDPVKIRVLPDRMVIASYPGPVPGVRPEHFAPDASRPDVMPRNRRIAEFFKELRLAEIRFTGVSKIFRAMKDNGSPPPEFDFDEGRTYFQVTLPAHPTTRSS